MRLALAAVLSLSLAGCATFKNPATVSGTYSIDASVGAAAALINQYRGLCAAKKALVYPKCRPIVPVLQSNLRLVRGQIAQAVAYVKANPGDTVGLTTLVTQAQSSLSQLQSDLRTNNVPGAQ